MCAIFGYEAEEHLLQTKDGYLLCLHRICRKKDEPYSPVSSYLRHRPRMRKPVVYLHHGLLMNSEVWVCQIEERLSLPFRLVEEGYDVWFGNNRGNKYSKKSLNLRSSKIEFWDFSMVITHHTRVHSRTNLHFMISPIRSIIFYIRRELKV
jgi:lysosomal acid lipase/cholesteryl ester hydrolase